jgi:hypothetical protein
MIRRLQNVKANGAYIVLPDTISLSLAFLEVGPH